MKLAVTTSNDYVRGYLDTPGLMKTLRDFGIEPSLQVWDDPAVDWRSFDAVLLHTTWDYTNKYQKFIDWCNTVSRTCKLVNDLDTIKSNSTKRYLMTLQEKGVAIPHSFLVEARQPVRLSTLQDHFDGGVVIKPLIDSGGVRARLFGNVNEAVGYIRELSKNNSVLIQGFVSEVIKEGERSAVMIGGKLSHVVRKLAAPGEFRVQDDWGGTVVADQATRELEEYSLDILRKLNQNPTYARIDFIDSETRVLMEVEMIEPELFLRFKPKSYERLADEILKSMALG